jgi:hypothetical protein
LFLLPVCGGFELVNTPASRMNAGPSARATQHQSHKNEEGGRSTRARLEVRQWSSLLGRETAALQSRSVTGAQPLMNKSPLCCCLNGIQRRPRLPCAAARRATRGAVCGESRAVSLCCVAGACASGVHKPQQGHTRPCFLCMPILHTAYP